MNSEPQYRCLALNRSRLNEGREAARPRNGGTTRILSSQWLDALESCSCFAGLETHARQIVDSSRSPERVESVRAKLEEFAKLGWLIEASELLDQFRQPEAGSPAAPGLQSLAIITCDRPESLRQITESYASEFVGSPSPISILVMDDSKSPEMRAQNLSILKQVQARSTVGFRIIGIPERRSLIKILSLKSGVDPEVIKLALLPAQAGGNSCGTNRNTHLLATAGECTVTVDDDTLNQFSWHPSRQQSIQFGTGNDPCDYWFHKDFESLATNHPPRQTGWLQEVEQFLGKSAAEIASSHPISSSLDSLNRIPSNRLSTAARERVLLVFPGHWGDPGWAAPYGYAGLPFGSLLLNRNSHARLVESESDYQTALTSRVLFRAAPAPTFSDTRGSVATFLAMDNRQLLPPFPPSGRSQDMIFGTFAGFTRPNTWSLHLPLGVAHQPTPLREFWKGEHLRTASGISWANFLYQAVQTCPTPAANTPPDSRLRILAEYFFSISRMAEGDFEEWAARLMRDFAQKHMDILCNMLADRREAPRFWSSDVQAYRDLLEKSQARPDFWHPLDILDVHSSQSPSSVVRNRLRMLGSLLTNWPELWNCARQLRQSGENIFGIEND